MTVDGIERTVLPGGLRVLTERMPSVRSTTFGIWAGVGSRDETPPQAGASHYLEHLLFKGTVRRSAAEIAAQMDAVGGEHNAFTSKEYTCFYARTLDRDLPLAVDVLVDMLRASRLDGVDVDAERTVILEEIGMHADDPDDLAFELFAAKLFPGHPLGLPELGTPESIRAMTRDQLAGYWRRWYTPSNLVVSVAGNVEHRQVLELVQAAFDAADGSDGAAERARAAPTLRGGVDVRRRDTEQAHVVYGTGAISRSDPRRFALSVFNVAFGGGMSSRLFQEIREKRGLAYSVSSFVLHYEETGVLSMHAGTSPKHVNEVLKIVKDEIGRILADGLSEEEVARGKGHLKGSFVLGLEDSASRMIRLGKSEVTGTELLGVDEVLARFDEVTLDDAQQVARDVLADGPRAIGVVGPFEGTEVFEEYL
ncbi:MAG TPA: pitrilysin family protein [Actinomycetes bacterium]|nr:pitrilysin family protein [Actinomycetes bacterium]